MTKMSNSDPLITQSTQRSGKDEKECDDDCIDTIVTQQHKTYIARTIKQFAEKSHGDFKDKDLQQEVVKCFNEKFNAKITIEQVRKELDTIRKSVTNMRKKNVKRSEANYQLRKTQESLREEAQNKKFRHEARVLLQAADNITELPENEYTKLQKLREKAMLAVKEAKAKAEEEEKKSSDKITQYFHVINKSESGLHVRVKKDNNLLNNKNCNSNSMETSESNDESNKENEDPNPKLTRKQIMFKNAGHALKRQNELDEQVKLRTEFYKSYINVAQVIAKNMELDNQIKQLIIQTYSANYNNINCNSNSYTYATPTQVPRHTSSA